MKTLELQSRIGAAETLLNAMTSQPRLKILGELGRGERAVGGLQQAVRLAMSPASPHLAQLRETGVVATRREAQTIHYALAGEAARETPGALRAIFCDASATGTIKRRKAP